MVSKNVYVHILRSINPNFAFVLEDLLYLIYFNIYLIHLHFSCVLVFFCLKKYLYIKQDSVFLHQKDKYLRKYIILKLDKICLIKLLILQSYAHYKFTKDETDRKLRDNNTYSSSKNKKVIRICIHQFKIFLILNVYSTSLFPLQFISRYFC